MFKENKASLGLLGLLPSLISSGNFPDHQTHSFHDHRAASSRQGNDKACGSVDAAGAQAREGEVQTQP